MLWVLAGNVRAIGFYESQGWGTDGTSRQAEVWGITVEEIRYVRSLDLSATGAHHVSGPDRRNRKDAQPTAHPHGSHITLRPLAAQDFHELFAAASDPLVWAQHPDPGRGTREGFPPFFDDALKSKGCLVAIDAARPSVIGWSRYSNYAPGERIAIGYTFLAPSHWGGAANAEMKQLMLRHAFTDVQEVLFSVAERNLRSRRAVEKLGAELAGAEDAPRWGQIHVIYRLTPQLWARGAVPGYGPDGE